MRRIIKYLEYTNKIEEKALEMLDKDVDRIINNHITDISVIESVLDTLLSFTLVDSSFVFNKLNDYYKTVNEEYSSEYKLLYNDMKNKDI